jgi:glycine cleavage system aminomethyltransferase T
MTEAVTVELDAQYRQLREECGLLDRSARGKLLLRGAEGAELLQGQLTNDIEALEPGGGCYAALLDRKGHMQADMRVLRLAADEIWVDTEPETLAATKRHLETYKIGRAVEVEDQTAERAILSLVGPRSADLAGAPPLRPYASASLTVAGIDCVAVGAALGVDLIAAVGNAERLRSALNETGAYGVEPAAVEILRIEAGTPRFGAEMDASTMLREGLLHRSGDGRPPALPGQAQPAPSRTATERPGARRSRSAAGRKGGRRDWQQLRLPRPRPDRAGDRSPRGRARRRARRR